MGLFQAICRVHQQLLETSALGMGLQNLCEVGFMVWWDIPKGVMRLETIWELVRNLCSFWRGFLTACLCMANTHSSHAFDLQRVVPRECVLSILEGIQC